MLHLIRQPDGCHLLPLEKAIMQTDVWWKRDGFLDRRDAGPYKMRTDVRKKPPLCKGRGTAIAVEGLFQREVTSSPNNPTASHSFGTSPYTGEANVQTSVGEKPSPAGEGGSRRLTDEVF